MSDSVDSFVAVDGKHFVTIDSGSHQFRQFIGVKGQLVSTRSDGMLKIRFPDQSDDLEVSVQSVVEYGADASETQGLDIGIYFGTETGNTETIAEEIAKRLADCRVTACKDIVNCSVAEFLNHDVLLLGVSTWNIGDIQYNWEEKLGKIGAQDYPGIKVGIFGLGDAAGYPDTFVDDMGILWDEIKGKGAELIGVWPTAGYDFDESKGLYDDAHFLGVVIDDDGEQEKTPERIDQWVAQIRRELGLTPSTEAAA